MNERMNERMDGWVSYSFVELQLCWTTALLSYCFVELLLCWATSSPSNLFALVSATSSLNTSYLSYLFPDPDLICPPASSSVASATRFFSSRSCCNAFSHFQLQSRVAQAMVKSYLSHSCYNEFSNLPIPLARRAATSLMLYSRANAFCHDRLQAHTGGASRRAASTARTPAHKSGAAPDVPVMSFFCEAELSLQSGAHFSDLIFQNCSDQSSSRCLCTFCGQIFQIEARNRSNRDPTLATPGATIPVKTRGFATESVFTREFTRFRTVTLPYYLMMGLTWWCGWHDGVNAKRMTILRNSEVF